jgi:hypothetical protein
MQPSTVAHSPDPVPDTRFGEAAAVESALAACGCAGRWSEADAAAWWADQGASCDTAQFA